MFTVYKIGFKYLYVDMRIDDEQKAKRRVMELEHDDIPACYGSDDE